jgi:hypothetical protein
MKPKKLIMILSLISLSLLFSLQAPAATKAPDKSNDELIAEQIKDIKGKLPMEVNQNVTWTEVKAGRDEIIYTYKTKTNQIFFTDQVKTDLKSNLIAELKKTKDVEELMKHNIKFTTIYLDQQGNELFRMTIKRDDLGY